MAERKTIKYSPELVPLVQSGEKTTTWRLWDDKDFKPGDEVDFIKRPELTLFARAKLLSVSEKTMGTITDEDRMGHEQYADEYATYTNFYKRPVTAQTPVKIIKFSIIELV